MEKIKIVFLIGSFDTGGKERQLAELIKGLPKEKYAITLVVKNADAHYLEFILDGITYQELKVKRFGVFALMKLYKLLNNAKPDIVHSWLSIGSIFLILLRIFKKFKLIDGSIRDASSPKGIQLIFRKVINNFADLIIANSNAGLIAHKVPVAKGMVINNGFDFSRIEKLDNIEIIRERWKITTKYLVGIVARIDKYKDHPTFIKAANLLLSKRNDITFIIVGDGKMQPIIRDMVNTEFVNYVIFTGNQSDVESIINAFDIGVLSSYCEGFPNTVMEYMALKKPVIATNVGGTSELVIDGKTGILVNKSNELELAEKLNYLIDHHDVRCEMGENGYQRLMNNFSLQNMCGEYSKVYLSQRKMNSCLNK